MKSRSQCHSFEFFLNYTKLVTMAIKAYAEKSKKKQGKRYLQWD